MDYFSQLLPDIIRLIGLEISPKNLINFAFINKKIYSSLTNIIFQKNYTFKYLSNNLDVINIFPSLKKINDAYYLGYNGYEKYIENKYLIKKRYKYKYEIYNGAIENDKLNVITKFQNYGIEFYYSIYNSCIIAIDKNKINSIKYLIENCLIDEYEILNIIVYLLRINDLELVEYMLKYIPKYNTIIQEYFERAITNNDINIVKLLLDYVYIHKDITASGYSALELASINGNKKVLKYILKNSDSKQYKNSAIFYANKYNHKHIVNYLKKHQE